MTYVDAAPNCERQGVVGGFTLSQGSGLVPGITLGVLFAQSAMYRPSTAPTLPAAAASQQSWLWYNTTSGFYWTSSFAPTVSDDAFIGWVVCDASSVVVWSGQQIEVPDPDGDTTVIPLGDVLPAGPGDGPPSAIQNLALDDHDPPNGQYVDYTDSAVARMTGSADLPATLNDFNGCEVFIRVGSGDPVEYTGDPIPVGHQWHDPTDMVGPYTFEIRPPRPSAEEAWRLYFCSRNDRFVAALDAGTPYVDVTVTARPSGDVTQPQDVQSIVLCPLAEIPTEYRDDFGEGSDGLANPHYSWNWRLNREEVGICVKITPPAGDANWLRSALYVDTDDGQGMQPVAEEPYGGTPPAAQYCVMWWPRRDVSASWKISVQSVGVNGVYGTLDPTDTDKTLTLTITGCEGIGYPTIDSATVQDGGVDPTTGQALAWITLNCTAPSSGLFEGTTLWAYGKGGESRWTDEAFDPYPPNSAFVPGARNADGGSFTITRFWPKPESSAETIDLVLSPRTAFFGAARLEADDDRNATQITIQPQGTPGSDLVSSAAIGTVVYSETSQGIPYFGVPISFTLPTDDANFFVAYVTVQSVNGVGTPLPGSSEKQVKSYAVPGGTSVSDFYDYWQVEDSDYRYIRFKVYVKNRQGTSVLQACWTGSATYYDALIDDPGATIKGTAIDGDTLGPGITKDATTGKPKLATLDLTNQAFNPSFADGLDHWEGDGTTPVVDTSVYYTASPSIRIDGGATAYQSLMAADFIPCRPGRVFRASSYVRSTAGAAGTAQVLIRFYDASLTTLQSTWGDTITATTTWTEIAVTATAPASTAYMRIWPIVTHNCTTGSWYIDDVVVRPVLVAGEIGGGAINDIDLFSSDLRPNYLVSSLPSLPDSRFPEGCTVALSTEDGRIYRNKNNAWIATDSAVNLTDLNTSEFEASGGVLVLKALNLSKASNYNSTQMEVSGGNLQIKHVNTTYEFDSNDILTRINHVDDGGYAMSLYAYWKSNSSYSFKLRPEYGLTINAPDAETRISGPNVYAEYSGSPSGYARLKGGEGYVESKNGVKVDGDVVVGARGSAVSYTPSTGYSSWTIDAAYGSDEMYTLEQLVVDVQELDNAMQLLLSRLRVTSGHGLIADS